MCDYQICQGRRSGFDCLFGERKRDKARMLSGSTAGRKEEEVHCLPVLRLSPMLLGAVSVETGNISKLAKNAKQYGATRVKKSAKRSNFPDEFPDERATCK